MVVSTLLISATLILTVGTSVVAGVLAGYALICGILKAFTPRLPKPQSPSGLVPKLGRI